MYKRQILPDGTLYEGDIPADFLENAPAYRFDENHQLCFDVQRASALKRKRSLALEAAELTRWLDEYDQKLAAAARCERLGMPYEEDLVQLDQLAREKMLRRNKINQLISR